jgi:integrase
MERLLRLTENSIREIKSPGKGATIFYDDTLAGFGVRVSEGGTKSFVLTHGPRRKRETIGRVGIISIQDARAEAKRRLAEYTLGKKAIKPIRWEDAVEEYLVEVRPHLKPRTYDDYEYYLGHYLRYGQTKLTALSPSEIRETIERLSNTPAVKHRVFGVLRAFLGWAYRAHYVDHSPLARMKAPPPSRSRERILNDIEIKAIWRALDDDIYGRIVKLLLLTGQRRGEIAALAGSMIGTDTITLPSENTKNGRQHVIPLGTMAASVLGRERLPRTLYFPARGKTTPFNGFSKAKYELDERCGVSDWTLHDLRRTFASGLASLGVPLHVIERLLNHVSGSFGGIVGVYQRYNFQPEMRDAITKWERYLGELTNEEKTEQPARQGPARLNHGQAP